MRRLSRFLLPLLFLPAFAHAQIQESELKAAVIYNFVQFTQWPDKAATINLCISPENPIHDALLKFVARAGQERGLAVLPVMNAGIGDCHVVFMSEEDRRKSAHFQRLLVGPVLGISDAPALLSGEMIIVMSVERSRVVFSVNNTKAVAFGLSISSRLLRLARSVQ